MVGLACTDSPASLGTSYMQFCQQNPDDSPLSARKQNPDTFISTAESVWEYKDEPKSVLASVKELFAAPTATKAKKVKKSLPLKLSLTYQAQLIALNR